MKRFSIITCVSAGCRWRDFRGVGFWCCWLVFFVDRVRGTMGLESGGNECVKEGLRMMRLDAHSRLLLLSCLVLIERFLRKWFLVLLVYKKCFA